MKGRLSREIVSAIRREGKQLSNSWYKAIQEFCEMDASMKDHLKAAVAQFNLSRRTHDRVLKVSRTIADMEDGEKIEMHHMAEAINYRAFDRKLFG